MYHETEYVEKQRLFMKRALWINAILFIVLGAARITGLYRVFYYITKEAQKTIDASKYLLPFDIVFGIVFILTAVVMYVAIRQIDNNITRGALLMNISLVAGIVLFIVFIVVYQNLILGDLLLSVRYYYIRTNVVYGFIAALLAILLIINSYRCSKLRD